MIVSPWNKEAKRILDQISKYGRGCIENNPRLPREFGWKYPKLIKNNFLDIATTRNRRVRRTWFVAPPDICIVPKPLKSNRFGMVFEFKRL